MGSRTVWADIQDNPDDAAAWKRLCEHYFPHVRAWAMKYVERDEDKADTIAAKTFSKLNGRVRGRSRNKKILPNDKGSYRQYVRRVLYSAAMVFFKEEKQFTPRLLTDQESDSLTSPDAEDRFGHEVEWAVELDERHDEMKSRYAKAVHSLKASRTGEVTFDCFVKYYGGRKGEDINREMGWCVRGKAAKYANRAARDLISLLDFASWAKTPLTEETALDFLKSMVRKHGDPS